MKPNLWNKGLMGMDGALIDLQDFMNDVPEGLLVIPTSSRFFNAEGDYSGEKLTIFHYGATNLWSRPFGDLAPAFWHTVRTHIQGYNLIFSFPSWMTAPTVIRSNGRQGKMDRPRPSNMDLSAGISLLSL